MNEKGFGINHILLIVIIVGIIVLIPVIVNNIEKAKKENFESEVDSIVEGIETYCQKEQLNGDTIKTKYDFKKDDIKSLIDVNVALPSEGSIELNMNCEVISVNVSNNSYKAKLNNGNIKVEKKK